VDRWLILLESIFHAGSFEQAVSAMAIEFGLACPSQPVGLFVVLQGRVYLEFCYPEDTPLRPELRAESLRLSAAFAAGEAGEPAASTGGQPRISYVFELHDRLIGVMTVADDPSARDDLDRVVRLAIDRLVAAQCNEIDRMKIAQFERWFRASDRQVRALDGERQKFAALVGLIQRPVFVTDPAGIILWVSRPLIEQVPEHREGSWIGRSCRDLCAAMDESSSACRDCAIGQALCAGLSPPSMLPDVPSAVAIKDLDGQPREVIVLLPVRRKDLEEAA
jgi:hypothetical protein